MQNIRLLSRVQISGAAGVCVGRIEDIRPVDELPDIKGFPIGAAFAAAEAVEVLREWGATRIALVSYFATEHQEVAFFALEIAGKWFDLQRQAIELEVIGQTRVS